jgi:hypothetical protein
MGAWYPVLCVDEWTKEPLIWTMNLDADLIILADKWDHFELKQNLQDEWRKEWRAKGWDQINPTPTMGNIAAEPRRPYIYIGDAAGRGTFEYMVWGEKLGWEPQINVETGEVRVLRMADCFGRSSTIHGAVARQASQGYWEGVQRPRRTGIEPLYDVEPRCPGSSRRVRVGRVR